MEDYFPGGTRGKESTCHCRRCKIHGFDPWVRKIPGSMKWQSTPVFLPSESHGKRGLVGYSPWGHRESDMTEQLSTHFPYYVGGEALSKINRNDESTDILEETGLINLTD